MNTNKGSIVKQSDNDVEGCRSEKVLFQPNMRVFLQYSVMYAKSSKPEGAETWASSGPGSLLPYAINYQDLMRVYT